MVSEARKSQRRFALLNGDEHSGERNEWSTPQALFDKLNVEFHFTLDACATTENAKCKRFFTREDDGLAQDWGGFRASVWCNCPYGHEIGEWIRSAWEQSFKGATVVCLIPSRTDTVYWHCYVMHADEIRFIRGRVKFGGMKDNAPFASSLVIFHGRRRRQSPLITSWSYADV